MGELSGTGKRRTRFNGFFGAPVKPISELERAVKWSQGPVSPLIYPRAAPIRYAMRPGCRRCPGGLQAPR